MSKRNRKQERRSSTHNAAGGDSYWSDFSALRTGPVNDRTAQSVSAVYACVQAISEAVATLPLVMYRRDGKDREAVEDHPLHHVLNVQPNPEQTAMEAREYLTACTLLRGNGLARQLLQANGQAHRADGDHQHDQGLPGARHAFTACGRAQRSSVGTARFIISTANATPSG